MLPEKSNGLVFHISVLSCLASEGKSESLNLPQISGKGLVETGWKTCPQDLAKACPEGGEQFSLEKNLRRCL